MKADVYSMGVCLFVLLFKMFPNKNEQYEQDQGFTFGGQLPFHVEPSRWKFLSTEIKDLLCSLLHEDPDQRPSVFNITMHPWFDVDVYEQEYEIYNLSCTPIENLVFE